MSGRLNRMGKQYASHGTSWYELVRIDALRAVISLLVPVSIDSIFYFSYVSLSLDALTPCSINFSNYEHVARNRRRLNPGRIFAFARASLVSFFALSGKVHHTAWESHYAFIDGSRLVRHVGTLPGGVITRTFFFVF